MKKIFVALICSFILCGTCFASCSCDKPNCDNTCQKENTCPSSPLEDDEYAVYNECYFDKSFKRVKKELCLTKQQEAQINIIYKNFKMDMEQQHLKYRNAKNKLLEMIACNNDCWKEQRKVLKEIKKETKQKAIAFRDNFKDELCKNQYSDFRRIQRQEKTKLKRIVKYGKIVKFPCVDCCNP